MRITQLSRRLMPALLVAMLFVATSVYAQFSASLAGTVQDASGAVIPGATITLTNDGSQSQKTVTSGGSGFYRFNELAPGSYSLMVTAPGFESSTLSGVVIAAESARNLDVKLSVGKSTQSISVNADTIPDLQTADGSVSSTIDSEAIERLPSFGADPYELIRTAPGITGDSARSGSGEAVFLPNGAGPGQSNSGIYQTENQIQISAAGLPTSFNNYMIDGVSVDSLGRGGAAVVTPNVDAVSQITVVSSSFSAEDGRDAGAQIKVVTKSGTNSLHGTARFQYDEPGLNAYNGFTGPSGQAPQRNDNKQRYYGGSLGGPIIKDKLFFFISGEAFQELNPGFSSQYVETPEYRALLASERPGNLANKIVAGSGAPRIAQVLTQSCANIGGPGLCQVVGDGIDLGSPYGAEGQYVPLALAQLGGGLDGIPDVQYVEIQQPTHTRARQYNARVDYQLTPNDQFAGSVYFTKLDTNGPSSNAGARPGDDVPFKPLNSAATLLYIHTFGSNTINELRANFTRFYDNGIKDAAGSVNYGIPSINIQNMSFDGTNDIQFGVAQSSTTPSIQVENTYEVRDMVTKVIGNHSIRMGFEYRPEQDNSNLDGENRPVYAIAGIWNFFNDTPIYEGIDANPATGGPASSQRYLRDHYYGAFVQHDWKVNANLTLNMGLRWEYFEPVYNKGFRVYQPVEDFIDGIPLADAGLQLHNHFYNTKFHDFSPKFGFAYVPPNVPSMVVRGGFALAYSRLPDSLFDPSAENGPGVANFGLCCGTAASDFGTPFDNGQILYALGSSTAPDSYPANPALKLPLGSRNTPAGETVETYGADPNTQNPYSYLYALEIQKEIGKNYVASIGYQGSLSRHEPRLVNQLFIYPQTGSPSAGAPPIATPFYAYYNVQTDSNGAYNGLNVQLNRRFNRGLTLSSVYTYSRSLDQISNGDGANSLANQTYPQDNRAEYGPSDYDVKHRIVASALWDIPGSKSSNYALKAATNGWQINGIFTAHTGFPFTPVTYTQGGLPSAANVSTIGPQRPYQYTGGLSFNSCGNDPYVTGSDIPNRVAAGGTLPAGSGFNYFNTTPTPKNAPPPGIGRNSFRGPCYQDIDLSVAKQQTFDVWGHQPLLRFQLNAYNALNHTNLTPFVNGNGGPSALIESSQFGIAQSADAGRVLELLVRLQF